MKRITTKQAAQMLDVSEQAIRMMIQLEKIPGAICYGPKCRRTYIITDEQVKNLMKGESHAKGENVCDRGADGFARRVRTGGDINI